MATFRFVGRDIDIHWNGYDITGPAGTVFSIPDQLYEEFEGDLRAVEPSLEWIDTNEFQTLENSVSAATLSASLPIALTTTTSGKNISLSSTTALNGYLLAADGSGGTIWTPASTSSLTSVIGVSPISTVISGGTVSVSLSANYQTAGSYQPAGTYVTGVVGTSPISATGTTAITVGIDQSAITAGNASSAQATVYLVRNNTASTILKGTLVSATGAEPSGRIDIAPFSVTGLQDSELRVMGIATENIGVGVNGTVMSFGTLTGLDTRGTAASALAVGDEDWDEGTVLYAHPTVPGKLTEVRPQHDLAVAFTTVRHGSTGQIAIRIVPGNFHLEWMHDVFVDGVSTALPLVYSSASSGWIAQALTSVGIADNAIVAAKIAAGAVGSAAIAAGAVVAGDIAANAVTSGNIAASAITSGHIATGAVGSAALATGAVVAAKIATGAVTSGHIAAAAVGTAALSSGAAANGTVLTANGSGAATFQTASIGSVTKTTLTGSGTWVVPTGVNTIKAILLVNGGGGGGCGGLTTVVGGTSVGTSEGGTSGRSASFTYAENIYLGTTTSFTYAVGSGGAGEAAKTFSKIATGTATSLQAISGTPTYNGVSSTFGSFTFSLGYGGSSITNTSGATNTVNAVLPSDQSEGSLTHGNATITTALSNATGSASLVGYWKPSDNFVAGSAGGSASSTITGGSPTTSTGTAGAAGATMTAWTPASGGGGNWSAAATPIERTAAAGYRGGSGGGAPIRVRLSGTSTVTSLIAGDGGNGVNGTGAAGGGGGSAILTAANTTDYNASTITNMESGAGGNGGNGTIIIWY